MFQDYALFPHLTVEENVGFGLRRLPAAVWQRLPCWVVHPGPPGGSGAGPGDARGA